MEFLDHIETDEREDHDKPGKKKLKKKGEEAAAYKEEGDKDDISEEKRL